MNIGTNTGAINAHFADAEPIIRLTVAVSKIKRAKSSTADSPSALSPSAPFTAMIRPSWVQLNGATKLRSKEYQYEIAAKSRHAVTHALDDIGIAADRPCTDAVGYATDDSEEEDDRDDA